jgi:hypothetical protein
LKLNNYYKCIFLSLLIFFCFGHATEARSGNLSPEYLNWGEKQLEKMLHDRPLMAPYVKKRDPLWNWTVRQFAGEWVQGGVEWDASEINYESASCGPRGDHKAKLLAPTKSSYKNFHKDQAKTGSWLWVDVIQEFCNLKRDDLIVQLDRKTLMERTGPEEYAYQRAMISGVICWPQTVDLLKHLWVPNCKTLNQEPWDDMSNVITGFLNISSEHEFTLQYFDRDFGVAEPSNFIDESWLQNRNYFLDIYNRQILPELKSKDNLAFETPVQYREIMKNMKGLVLLDDPKKFYSSPFYEKPNPLTKEDLNYGEKQLKKVLRDRPAMVSYVSEGDVVWTWTVRQFAGEHYKSRIEWESANHTPDSEFDYVFTNESMKVTVNEKSVTTGLNKSGSRLWMELVAALIGADLFERSNQINYAALKGKIGIEEYFLKQEMLMDAFTLRRSLVVCFITCWTANCEAHHLNPTDEDLVKEFGDLHTYRKLDELIQAGFQTIQMKENFEKNQFTMNYKTDILPMMKLLQVAVPPSENLEELKKRIKSDLLPLEDKTRYWYISPCDN